MIVTINTDASFSREFKIGTYAFWIVCNDFKILKSGVLRQKCDRPDVAEFKCIINAVYMLSQQKSKRISKIIINTDCLNVIHVLKKDTQKIKLYGLGIHNKLARKFNELIMFEFSNCPVELRHVKAHTTIEGARNWVNDWCDKKAKEEMNKKLFELKKSA